MASPQAVTTQLAAWDAIEKPQTSLGSPTEQQPPFKGAVIIASGPRALIPAGTLHLTTLCHLQQVVLTKDPTDIALTCGDAGVGVGG